MKKNISLLLAIVFMSQAYSQTADPKEMVAMVKNNLATSMQNLKTYQWIETTTIFMDGKQKSQTIKQCYYSVDGKLTKVEAAGGQDAKSPGGLRGRVAANKKEEISDYAKKCIDKIESYLPPEPEKLQAVYNAGKLAIKPIVPNKQFQLDFADYQMPGDLLSIGLNKEKTILTGVGVGTYVDKPDDKVSFKLKYSQLPDGTQYPSETVLDLPAKKIKIVIANSGYKKGS